MTGYTKLFSSIIGSTIWREAKETKIVWITLLAMADERGIAEASIPGLADFAKVTVPECESALAVLMAPDPYSRTKDCDGRRIEVVDGGWRLINHGKYRAKMSKDERLAYQRGWDKSNRPDRPNASYRKPITPDLPPTPPTQNRQPPTAPDVNPTPPTHTEAEAEAKAEAERGIPSPPCPEVPSLEEATAQAALAGAPADFAGYVFEDWSGRQGRDASGTLVRWPNYIAKRWNRERVEWTNGTHRGRRVNGNGVHVVNAPVNGAMVVVYQKELERIEKVMSSIRSSYESHQSWSPDDLSQMKALKAKRVEMRKKLGLE